MKNCEYTEENWTAVTPKDYRNNTETYFSWYSRSLAKEPLAVKTSFQCLPVYDTSQVELNCVTPKMLNWGPRLQLSPMWYHRKIESWKMSLGKLALLGLGGPPIKHN